MSTYYLFDAANALSGSPVEDVVMVESKTAYLDVSDLNDVAFDVSGRFAVRVPDLAQVNSPTTLDDLLTQKYGSILSRFVGYSSVVYEDFTSEPSLDSTPAGTSVGDRLSTRFEKTTLLTSDTVALGSTPVRAVVLAELFDYSVTDPVDGVTSRVYREFPEDLVRTRVSFNGGSTWMDVTPSIPFEIDVSDQGSTLMVALGIVGGSPSDVPQYVFPASWALVY